MRCVKWLTGLFFLMVTLPALTALAQEKGPSQTPVIYAASFPCERASTLVEHAICQNEDLAKRDLEMARRYQSVMSMSDPDQQNSIESDQVGWLWERNRACSFDASETAKIHDCLAGQYDARIAVLAGMLRGDIVLQNVSVASDKAVSETCFVFDHELRADQDLELRAYIELSPKRDYSARISNGALCLFGLPHSQITNVTLRKGLRGPHDFTLAEDLSHDVKVGTRRATISLGTNSYILPKSDTPVLPVTTVNHDRVALKFYRVVERNIVTTLTRNLLARELDNWDMRQISNDIGAEIWSGTLDIRNRPDQDVVTQIPLRDMVSDFKPGLYVLVASDPDQDESWANQPTQWLVVTDLGLSAYSGENGLSLQVRSLKSAEPVGRATVRLVARNNEILGEAVTRADGWADLSGALLNGTGGKQAVYLTAETRDGDFSFISLTQPALELSDHGVAGKAPPKPLQTYLYSERGIYRPGETVKLGYLLRDDKANARAQIPLTIVLYQPDGKEVFKTVQSPDDLGGGRVDIPISGAAATGKWRIAAYSDPKADAIGNLEIQVEEFVPERLEVSAHVSAPYMAFGASMPVDVQTDYLFGAPGSGLRVSGDALLQVDHKPFETYGDYYFGLASETAQIRNAFDPVKSDDSGYAELKVPAFDEVDVSSPLRVRLNIEVADIDGRPSRATVNLPLRNSDTFVGVRARFDGDTLSYGQAATFDAIALNATGDPIANHELQIEWVREERDYNWFYQDGRWQSSYEKYDIPVDREIVTTGPDGVVSFDRGFDDWGYYRAVIRDTQTGSAADHTFHVGWWSNGQSPDRPDQLALTVEADDVKPGDTINGFVKAPFEGRLQVTVAHKNILWRQEFDLSADGTEFSIPVRAEWGSGAYVLATAYRAGLDTDQHGPFRAVGAKWISFDSESHRLKVDFDLPDEVLPSSHLSVPVTVSGEVVGDEDLRVNVFAVDEGILRLTGFRTPRPDLDLLAQQYLQLGYYDLYGHLIAPQSGDAGTIRSGGDETDSGNLGSLRARVFKSVALASDTLKPDENGVATAQFDLPDFNGKLRFFAVAYSKTATGGGAANMLVRAPIVAELLPARFQAPGDVSNVALRLQNLSGPAGDYHARLSSSDEFAIAQPDWNGVLAQGQQIETAFDITARKIGVGTLTLDVSGPDGYRQQRQWDMEVRPAQPWENHTAQSELTAGDVLDFDADILGQYLPETVNMNLTLSSVPEIRVQDLITALDRYPYGCLEQTTSRAFPLLSFGDAQSRWNDVRFDAAGLDDKIRDGIVRILAKQRGDGSFGFWDRHNDPEPWLTAYATDFLTAARARGYTVLDDRFDDALDWMQDVVRYEQYPPEARAYMVLVLARNDRYSVSNLKYEAEKLLNTGIGSLARAQVNAALVTVGADADPVSMDDILQNLGSTGRYYHSFGSSLRDLSAILTLPKEIFASETERLALLRAVTEQSDQERYTSTQEKGWLLQAATSITKDASQLVSLRLNGRDMEPARSYRLTLPPELVTPGYMVENIGDHTVFARWSVTGIPASPLAPEAHNLSIKRQYFDLDGKPASLENVKTGDRLIVVLSGKSTAKLSHRALVVDLLPAGFEIESNAHFPELDGKLSLGPDDVSWTDFRAERDDRFVASINIGSGGYGRYEKADFRLSYVVRAVTPGTYILPAPYIEDMYKPAFFARGAVSSLVVKPIN
ncbi:MAG: hypothetical protein CMO03_11975 [Thalassospira sp.]|jgi:hypothetical protein|uniref:Alpha-2-macroglobulin n=2 Tax=Thalassospiraceae TaxID=2844866 RepID=A0ABR5Y290_9PROT|nr:hypothetical protein AUP40_17250 [Thalassospira xiamenensis]MAL30234.1 hypothetical protein [Thalassospira sp.]OCK07670.1 alpha-2-macroglobulin domain protein 2 [Thalassospira sp. KO164]PXX32623.1 hypothetical protein C7967_104102 [Thalassospira sp. 11-3]SEE18588.1 hypothetical protein SAMN04515623_1861 [Thalassospira permensis]|tara:strand:- start:12540 stop:17612 length:5073 start_codon:yes stop_codon:yes gene_type:complete